MSKKNKISKMKRDEKGLVSGIDQMKREKEILYKQRDGLEREIVQNENNKILKEKINQVFGDLLKENNIKTVIFRGGKRGNQIMSRKQ